MTRRLLRILFGVVASITLPRTSATHAQPAPPDSATLNVARSYVDAGLAAQGVGDYDTAITFYSKAYEIAPHPLLLFNIAQAHRLAAHLDQAELFYRRFLAANWPGPEAQIAQDLLAEIAQRKMAAARWAADRRDTNRPHDANADVTETAHADPGHLASSTPPESDSGTQWSTRRKIAMATATAGVVALGVGTALGISAKIEQRDAHARCPDPRLACDDADRANELIRSGHYRAIGADVAFGVGTAAAIAASVLWLTAAPGPSRRVAFTPAPAPRQVAITASGSF